jgi:CheY-like chemotaxis protein
MDEKQVKVLFVDDEPDFAQTVAFRLRSKGYIVHYAKNGHEGIELIKKEKPDIVFMDLKMPVMDGVESLKKIREFDKDLPVVMISAFVNDQRFQEARDYGFSGVFYKGKDLEEGILLLESAIRTHKQLKK